MTKPVPIIENGTCRHCGGSKAGRSRGSIYCSEDCKVAACNNRKLGRDVTFKPEPVLGHSKPIVITPAQAARFDAAWKAAHGRRKYRDHKKGV